MNREKTAAHGKKRAGLDLKNGVFHGRPIYLAAILLLLAALIASLAWAVTIGSVDLKMSDVYLSLIHI